MLSLDADVMLTHYRLQKLGEQQLNLEAGEAIKLRPVSEVGTGREKAPRSTSELRKDRSLAAHDHEVVLRELVDDR